MKTKTKQTKPAATSRIAAAEMAALLSRSEERLRQLVRAGTLPAPSAGRYEPVGTLAAWVKHLDERLAERVDGGKARIANARAALLENRLAVELGRFIPEEEVRRDITRGFGQLKAQLLVLPNRLGQVLALETDPITVEEKIRAEIFAVLDLMSRDRWAAKTS